MGVPVLRIGPVAGLIHLITHDGTGYGTNTGTDEGAFTLVARLVTDNGTKSGTQGTTEEGTVLRGGRVTAREDESRQQYGTKCEFFHGIPAFFSVRHPAFWGRHG